MMDNHHGKEVLFAIRSAPVGYAAEYLTCGAFAAIPMGSFPLMSMNCILYHFWGVDGYRLWSLVLIRTPQIRVFPFSSSIRIRFIRSHRPHAAPSKHRGFREVVLMCVCCILYHFPSLHVLLDYNHFVYFVVQIFEHTSVG